MDEYQNLNNNLLKTAPNSQSLGDNRPFGAQTQIDIEFERGNDSFSHIG